MRKSMDISDIRMLALIDMLKANGTIRFSQDFCDAIGMDKQRLGNIKRGETRFTIQHIEKACEVYNVNANWLFGLEDYVFRRMKR